jgi:hypothetical protein
MRSFDGRMAVGAQVSIAEIIGEDEDDVWPIHR